MTAGRKTRGLDVADRYTQSMTTQTPAQQFAPPTFTPITGEPAKKKAKWPFVVGVVVVIAVIGTVAGKKPDSSPSPGTPAKSGDVCFWMRDGSAGNLTPSDWQDLGKFSSHGLMVQYVAANCPEQLARVDG